MTESSSASGDVLGLEMTGTAMRMAYKKKSSYSQHLGTTRQFRENAGTCAPNPGCVHAQNVTTS
jgi:hypothetical protein